MVNKELYQVLALTFYPPLVQWLDWDSALFFSCEIRSTLINHFQTPYILLLPLTESYITKELLCCCCAIHIKKGEMGIMWIKWKNVLHLYDASRTMHSLGLSISNIIWKNIFWNWVNIYRFAKYSVDAACEILEHLWRTRVNAVNFQKLCLCPFSFRVFMTNDARKVAPLRLQTKAQLCPNLNFITGFLPPSNPIITTLYIQHMCNSHNSYSVSISLFCVFVHLPILYVRLLHAAPPQHFWRARRLLYT